jgi:YHS domain-containing protein
MQNAGTFVDDYLRALYSGDLDSARQYLADDLSFQGPAAAFATADDYLRATRHAAGVVKGVEVRRVFVDGAEVAVLYDLHLDHAVGSIAIADWYRLEDDGKIASIRSIFDTGPFTPTGGDTAVDPVCGMRVSKASPAVTRAHAGETYAFCSAGCAEAFTTAPERYVGSAA